MKKEPPILWEPTEKQAEFLSCPAREVLFAGSVGSGKTDAILAAGLSQIENSKHRALILRRTFPMLRDVIGRSHELFLPLGATFNKGTSQWTFPSGAILEFGFLDSDEDKFRYMGRAFSLIAWDELTSWPGDGTDSQGQPVSSAYVYLLSRLRAIEGSGLRLEVRATCTPGGIGHSWVKSRWGIPNDGSSSEVIDPRTGYRRVFIRATIADNPFLHNTEYERSLAALPEASRKALLEGRWDVFEGAVFSEFDHSRHTCDSFPIPVTWEIWRGADDGYALPGCVLWLSYDETNDRIFVIQELYQRGLIPEELARATLAIDRSIPIDDGGEVFNNDLPLDGAIDSAAFAEIGLGAEGGKGSRGDIMNSYGCKWRPAPKGAGSRLHGLSAIHQRLALRRDGYGGLVIFRGCRNLIRTLPAMVYSRTNPDDIDDSCEQHAVDALRYGLTRLKTEFRLMRVYGI
jgi:Terminase large subunit, T4likevirus-type, N-terminal